MRSRPSDEAVPPGGGAVLVEWQMDIASVPWQEEGQNQESC